MSFRKQAQRETSGSNVIEGREKATTAELLDRFPECITLVDFDIIQGKRGPFPVFNIAEDPDIYFCGGKILTEIAFAAIDECGGDIEEARAGLRADPCPIKLIPGRTKEGNACTFIQVLP